MSGAAKTAEELAAETWPEAERMEQAPLAELTLEEALSIMQEAS